MASTDNERDQQVSTYVTEETKEQLKNEARREGVALSEYVRSLIERARLEDTQEQLARDLNAEERLLELIAEGKDEIAEMAEQVEQQNRQVEQLLAKSEQYSIVNFQLLKATHAPTERQVTAWFDAARTRLDDDRTSASDGESYVSHAALDADGGVGDDAGGGVEQEPEEEREREQEQTDEDAASFVDELR